MAHGTHCIGCKKPFRGRKQKIANFPGTVQHRSAGNCTQCAQIIKDGKSTPSMANAALSIALRDSYNKRINDEYVNGRNKRLQQKQRFQKVHMVTK